MQYALLIVHELDGVNFLIELDRFEMVELRLVRLDLRKVPVVEISGVLQLIVLEYDDSASLISDGQILACLVVGDCGKQIILGHILLISLTQSIDVHPVAGIGDAVRIDLRLPLRLVGQVLGWHNDLS